VKPLYAPGEKMPSRRAQPGTMSRLATAGMLGLVIGLIACFAVGAAGGVTLRMLGNGVMERNMLIKLTFLGGFFFYFVLAPLLPSVSMGIAIGLRAQAVRCQSVGMVRFVSLLLGSAAALLMVSIAPVYGWMGKAADRSGGLRVAAAVYGVIGLLIAAKISVTMVRGQRICGDCEEFMKEECAREFALGDLKTVLITLYGGPPPGVPVIREPDGKTEFKVIETGNYGSLSVLSCSCNAERLVEVTATSAATTSKRLVFSGRVARNVLGSLGGGLS
jgi:hypothetical protein